MATGRIELSAEVQGLRELRDKLGTVLANDKKSEVLKKALEKAIQPVVAALNRTTPLGPTGNLRRAIDSKVVSYPADGNAVGVVGFRRAGRERSVVALAGGSVRAGADRGFHQYWLEEGTGQRHVFTPANKPYTRKAHTRTMKSGTVAQVQTHEVARQGGYIASSFRKLGKFQFEPTPRVPRGGKGQEVKTNPAYQQAFFRKSSTPITIPAMRPGGRGSPPLKTAFDLTRSTVAEILSRELRLALEDIWGGLATSTTGRGTIE